MKFPFHTDPAAVSRVHFIGLSALAIGAARLYTKLQ